MRVYLVTLALVGTVLIVASVVAVQQHLNAASEQTRFGKPVRLLIPIKNRKSGLSPNRIRVNQGDVLELTFTSDESAELHLHGYDELITVDPNAPGVLRLEATAVGRFPIEAHRFGSGAGSKIGHVELTTLVVYPR
jgi:FtsP/CotA-like multicopper oxidase with cupredoxin domain